MGRQSQPRVAGEGEDLGPPKEWGAMEGFGFSQLPLGADGRGVSQEGGKFRGWVVGDGEKRSDLGGWPEKAEKPWRQQAVGGKVTG